MTMVIALPRPRRRGRGVSVLVSALLLLYFGLWALYTRNNQPVYPSVYSLHVPGRNGYDDYVRATVLVRAMKRPPAAPVSGGPAATRPSLRSVALEIGPVRDLVRSALKQEYAAPWRRRYRADYPTSHSADFDALSGALVGAADRYAAMGDLQSALDLRLDCMEMTVRCVRGADCRALFSLINDEQLAEHGMEPMFDHLSPAQLAQTAERLDRIARERISFGDTILVEARDQIGADSTAVTDPRLFGGYSGICSAIFRLQGTLTWRDRLRAFEFMMANKHDMLYANYAYGAKLADFAQLPYTGARAATPMPANLLARSGPTYAGREMSLKAEAVGQLLIGEVALLRYRDDRGSYPRTLADLSPHYVKAVPTDPFGGFANCPLHYIASTGGQSYRLYSLGPNLRDDGGSPENSRSPGTGDLVAGKLAYSAAP